MGYRDVYDQWRSDPEQYWLKLAGDLDWETMPDQALHVESAPFYTWFRDGKINTCWNAVDRHVEAGYGDQAAIIHDSPVTGSKETITFGQLKDRVARLAGAMLLNGLQQGDRAIVYMPMIPDALVAMLACARIGVIHSVVFGGFAARELAVRIDDARPRIILSASCGIEPGRIVRYKPLLDEAIDLAAHKPDACVIRQRDQARCDLDKDHDFEWDAYMAGADPAPCIPVAGDHPAYILYTSGTTGKPKGVVRPTAGHLVALQWSMKNIYDTNPGEVFWAASDVGWVVGHSYICYAPLLTRNTTIVYEGKPVGTPDAGAFWRVISEHGVTALFTAPTAFRAIRREDPEASELGKYDLSGFRILFLAGERADPDTILWAEQHLQVPVIDHWWQTETGWAITGNPMGIEFLPVKHGSASVPMPGYDIRILDDECRELPRGALGSIAIRLPLPPGTFPTLWNADERYYESYLERFPGYYNTGDAGYLDEDGYVYIMSRTDDVINVAGHRLSTGALEEAVACHPDVAECAVIGVSDELKGQVPLALVCLNAGVDDDPGKIGKECITLVRERIGPVASMRSVAVVKRLPKTRSGKILRSTMVKIADAVDFTIPATIDDPAIVEEISQALREIGYAAGHGGT